MKGLITTNFQAQFGKALSVLGDAGWGTLVKKGKEEGHFLDELVTACVKMLREWNPFPSPTWVTCVPSLRHPKLVPDFAQRLASALNLPFIVTLIKNEERPLQKSFENSTLQARNIDGAFIFTAKTFPRSPVLLIDDLVDSRWTLTISAWLLRKGGCGEVWPLVLSQTGLE